MKVFAATIVAMATAEKKVPPRHPLQRLTKLNAFANEWIADNLSEKQAANWGSKFDKNTARMEKAFDLCGFYDETSEHGGPRERRSTTDDSDLTRYDQSNPIRGIQQITKGFAKWAQRYIAECKVQPAKQVDRMNKWQGQLVGKYQANIMEPEDDEEEATAAPYEEDNDNVDNDNEDNDNDSGSEDEDDNDSEDEGY